MTGFDTFVSRALAIVLLVYFGRKLLTEPVGPVRVLAFTGTDPLA